MRPAILCLACLFCASPAFALGTDPEPGASSDPFAGAPAPAPAPAANPNDAPPPQVVDQTAVSPMIIVQQPVIRVAAARPPRRLPYRAGQPIPPGYQPISRSRPGLWIPGLIMLIVPWAISAGSASLLGGLDDLYIPVAGPFLARDNAGAAAGGALVFDGIVQTAGAVMFVLGLVLKRHYLVYMGGDQGRYLGINPGPGGISLDARF